MPNVMPKFESSRLNGVAVIAKTYKHTHILPNLGNAFKKNDNEKCAIILLLATNNFDLVNVLHT